MSERPTSDSLNTTASSGLSEHEEIVLSQWVDGEAGWLARFRAQRLLKTRPEAREFCSYLRACSETLRGCTPVVSSDSKVDLWSRIERRIKEEQKLEVYLGKRQSSGSDSHDRHHRNRALIFGGGGAVTMLAGMLLLMSPFTTSVRQEQASDPAGAAPVMGVIPASLPGQEKQGKHGLPRIIERNQPIPLEVDWMRSDGRVHVVQDSDERSTIVWVKRRRRADDFRTPLTYLTPSFGR
jgi:hypothetical protein